jgi:hypothetical protein
MKVVINVQYGGFGLSPRAIKRLAELQGRDCYFYKVSFNRGKTTNYSTLTLVEAEKDFYSMAYDTPKELWPVFTAWEEATLEERKAKSDWYSAHMVEPPTDRHDPLLIQVVEELGEVAAGSHTTLKIVEIPDGTDYTIEEYDGLEHIAEVHKTWS